MSQATATKLVSQLRYKLHDRRKLKNIDGPLGRHNKIKKTVTALFKYERIELNYHAADESRGYAERLISEAIRYGDRHKPTMEMASYWIIEPQIVHKLFKVLAPRYKDHDVAYTKLWRAPNVYPGYLLPKCVLELQNNIYPSLIPDKTYNKNLIHNVLLEEAKKVYMKNKAEATTSDASTEKSSGTKSDSKVHESLQTQAAVHDNLNAQKESLTKEVESDKNLKAEGVVSEDVGEANSEMESSVENDLSKMKITEEKPKTSISKDEN